MNQPSHDAGLFDHCPWLFAGQASEEQRAAQDQRQQRLLAGPGEVRLGEGCFVAETAAVYPDLLHLGDRSYIAAQAYVTGEIRTGADCTVNPFTVVRGTVTLGDGVRIGAHSSLLGFNHGSAPGLPVHQQPVTSRGITVGDDVWIGSHVVVVDGVTIGDHCVVGAGAVVTKDLPAWSVAAGNPARRIRDRREPRGTKRPAGTETLAEELAAFAETARAQATDLLNRSWRPDTGRYADRPGSEPTVRAHCDAVEIADLLLGDVPSHLPAAGHVERLRASQDPATGLVPEYGAAPPLPGPAGLPEDDGPPAYHVLCVGYALDLLGSSFAHPVHAVRTTTADRLVRHLGALPWDGRAWHAGAWVDSWATAAHWNLCAGGEAAAPGALEALFGWLHTHADPWTGMWGSPSQESGRLQMVNGYYRLTRGSFAQFGLPVPYPERVIDTVLDHARDTRHFAPGRENACNVLDVIHPLWLCGRQTTHRGEETRAWAATQLSAALRRWHPGQGFGFGPTSDGTGPGREPGLQGTEMWLAIIWLLADALGLADVLGYRPRGIHRPEPAPTTERQ
ncbi:acyltransferase [Streptomyces hawaiiensis]|uniref:Acetyltransferase n=1 Tax=Streptomyces hawaiiensis TaxID=67305 RepID=A0A6G5RLA0_9ACTN|nr:acyltransferase [Streptomyces hawaiiensis]QCD58556.1 acetyltransferase [Streptomyces hawaiiensis]